MITLQIESAPLGTMNFGKRTSEGEARRIVDRALELGIAVLDTANVYTTVSRSASSGACSASDAPRFASPAKPAWRASAASRGLGQDTLVRACEDSLKRLGTTDWIDCIIFMSRPSHAHVLTAWPASPRCCRPARSVSWGVSNYAAWQILELIQLCTATGWRGR